MFSLSEVDQRAVFQSVLKRTLVDRGSVATPGHLTLTLNGTFEALTLYDLIINLTLSGTSSRLYVLVDDEEASVTVHEGEVVAAAFRGQQGMSALTDLFCQVHNQPNIEFVVQPATLSAAPYRNIDLPLQAVLGRVVAGLESDPNTL